MITGTEEEIQEYEVMKQEEVDKIEKEYAEFLF